MLYNRSMELTMTKRPLTLSEAADKYHIDTSTLRHAIRQNRLKPAYKAGKTWFVNEAEVERFIRERNPSAGRPLGTNKS